ncbi:contact-dependent growth inhibition system immunity protein [Mycolicibacterium vaccae]|uniref:contact-dependent growth inhibition system immunity protein n=1 Tax=Mycolicibacterium vaccae TaxID=1810 RepID=UPI003D0768E9
MNDGSISTELEQFFGAYFHQYWDLEADDWQGIVDNYVNADPVAEPLMTIAREIDELCAARSEADLTQLLLRDVIMCYDPRPEMSFKQWLGQIAARLRQHAAASDGGAAPQAVSAPLRHFFGVYFHEDWVLEADTWQGVVDSYVRDEKPSVDLLRSLSQEIGEVSAQCAEPDMRRLVTRTLGANYYPLPEFTYAEWLGQVAARLRQHAAASDGGETPPTA